MISNVNCKMLNLIRLTNAIKKKEYQCVQSYIVRLMTGIDTVIVLYLKFLYLFFNTIVSSDNLSQ